jgi:carbamoyltransferase
MLMILVSGETNPLYWDLINTFGQRTGIPMLLNTSFNENELIVCTPEETLAYFLRTDMDVLVLGHYYLAKKIAVQALTLKKLALKGCLSIKSVILRNVRVVCRRL